MYTFMLMYVQMYMLWITLEICPPLKYLEVIPVHKSNLSCLTSQRRVCAVTSSVWWWDCTLPLIISHMSICVSSCFSNLTPVLQLRWLCSPGWLEAWSVAQAALKLTKHFPWPPECWDDSAGNHTWLAFAHRQMQPNSETEILWNVWNGWVRPVVQLLL